MDRAKFSEAMHAWCGCLGKGNIFSSALDIGRYQENINGLSREILGILKPATTVEVQEVVKIANYFRVPLYPVSIGNNWGYGSKLPVRDGAVVLDLSRMNQVRNAGDINVRDHYALIEPGVTQKKLYDLLIEKNIPLIFNATAAGENTSVLGNSLDRGFGYFTMRPEDISGMEVVLGNGEIIRTGYGHYKNALATNHYKYGLGPSLDGLFFQSNFGIVTCAAFNLMPRREYHDVVLARLEREQDFPLFVDALGELRRQAFFESVLHIGNKNRMRITLAPLIYQHLLSTGLSPGTPTREKAESLVNQQRFSAWSAVGGLYGSREEVREKVLQIKKRLTGLASVNLISEMGAKENSSVSGNNQEALLEGVKPLIEFSLGKPSDGALLSPIWASGGIPEETIGDLDQKEFGLLFCCPSLPLNGKIAEEVVECAKKIFAQFGFDPFMTLNIVNTKALLLVLNMVFQKKDPARNEAAHRCVDVLFEEWEKMGIYPYRLGIQSMEQFITEGDPFWKTVKALKQVFDPNEVIAPGRYNLI